VPSGGFDDDDDDDVYADDDDLSDDDVQADDDDDDDDECTTHAYFECQSDDIYWFDSCGDIEDKKSECGAEGCDPGDLQCNDAECGDGICNGAETQCSCPNDCGTCSGCCSGSSCLSGNTESSCGDNGQACDVCTGGEECEFGECTCIEHDSTSCDNGDVYWFDSCGNREGVYDDCTGGEECQGSSCVCVSHDYTACSGDDAYWYDSCGDREEMYDDCGDAGCDSGTCLYFDVGISSWSCTNCGGTIEPGYDTDWEVVFNNWGTADVETIEWAIRLIPDSYYDAACVDHTGYSYYAVYDENLIGSSCLPLLPGWYCTMTRSDIEVPNIPTGWYWWLVKADDENNLSESNGSNNAACSASAVYIDS